VVLKEKPVFTSQIISTPPLIEISREQRKNGKRLEQRLPLQLLLPENDLLLHGLFKII